MWFSNSLDFINPAPSDKKKAFASFHYRGLRLTICNRGGLLGSSDWHKK